MSEGARATGRGGPASGRDDAVAALGPDPPRAPHVERDKPVHFFRIRAQAGAEVRKDELQAAYDRVHGDYDAFWLVEAARPIRDLIDKLSWRGDGRAFEAGCGTAFYDALDPARSDALTADFIALLAERKREAGPFTVVHDDVACVARRPE